MAAAMDTGAAVDDRTLVITREHAPPSLVFKAWTDPARAARRAAGFAATHVKGDLRPGGTWRTCLRRDEDGKELWQGGVYREVVEPERLVSSPSPGIRTTAARGTRPGRVTFAESRRDPDDLPAFPVRRARRPQGRVGQRLRPPRGVDWLRQLDQPLTDRWEPSPCR